MLRALVLAMTGTLLMATALTTRSASATTPDWFFQGIDRVVISLRADPVGQKAFNVQKVAESVRSIMVNSSQQLARPIPVEFGDPYNPDSLTTGTLLLLVYISIRDVPGSIGLGRHVLLATSVTAIRNASFIPAGASDKFTVAPEPIIAAAEQQDIERQLEKTIGRQLESTVIKRIVANAPKK
jgi:hypothetical protein